MISAPTEPPASMPNRPTLLILTILLLVTQISGRFPPSQHHHNRHQGSQVTDFRYNTARIDAIGRLFNDSLIVISNDHYWLLDKGQLPRPQNVKGHIRQLYSGFDKIDALWVDPYNDVSPQIYIASNSVKHGLRVVCQEFFEDFTDSSSFCHLPVDQSWRNALKDLNPRQPIDAVTWRNRTKDKDGGFWVFFQGHNMITIDPYEMHPRYTYDIRKWMGINETLTAVFYDYRSSEYHIFLAHNKYYKWTVNVTFMNRLPMSWDRAFLHGTLSSQMKINRDFFGFDEREIRNWDQPRFEDSGGSEPDIPSAKLTTTRMPFWLTTTTTTTTSSSALDDNKPKYNFDQNFDTKIKNTEVESNLNSLGRGDIRYQKQLLKFAHDEVLDFAPKTRVRVASSSGKVSPPHLASLFLLPLMLFIAKKHLDSL